MQMRNTRNRFGVVGLLLVGTLVIGACGSGDDDTDTGAANEPSMEESMGSTMDPMMAEPFGDGCAAVPEDGQGSFDGMADDPVATAASNNPALSTLVTAVDEAGLVDTLNSAEEITVFAPANDAFEALDPKTLKAAMKDPKGLLTTVLTYHVIEGRIAPEDLAGTHTTLQGDDLEVTGSGEDFTVNGTANMICGNVQTGNATVYIIDGILMPEM